MNFHFSSFPICGKTKSNINIVSDKQKNEKSIDQSNKPNRIEFNIFIYFFGKIIIILCLNVSYFIIIILISLMMMIFRKRNRRKQKPKSLILLDWWLISFGKSRILLPPTGIRNFQILDHQKQNCTHSLLNWWRSFFGKNPG